jgi:hypothetical protein
LLLGQHITTFLESRGFLETKLAFEDMQIVLNYSKPRIVGVYIFGPAWLKRMRITGLALKWNMTGCFLVKGKEE